MSPGGSWWDVWGASILRSALIPILVLGYLGITEWQRRAQEAANPAFPDFSLPIVGKDAEKMTRSQYMGRPFLVTFWATWCIPCKKQRETLEPWVKSGPWQAQVLGVATLDTAAQVVEAEAKSPHPFPSIMDDDGAIAEKMGIQALPYSVIVDKNGRVSRRFAGPLSANDLQVIQKELGAS